MSGLRAIIAYHQSDELRAMRLRRALCAYVIPSAALDTKQKTSPKRLGPIGTVALDGDLDRKAALSIEAADYLILVCSPAAALSQTVNKAASIFTSDLRARSIIPVVIAGEPGASRMEGLEHTECLPPALRFAVDDQCAPSNHPVSPDCIEARLDHSLTKPIYDIAVQIAARMLDAPIDHLRSQDRRRRRKAGFVTGVAVAAAMGFIAALPALYIDAQQASLSASAKEISSIAHRLLDQGEPDAAISTLTTLFPSGYDFADPPYPIPPEALSALTRAALETRVLADMPAPVDDITELRLLPEGALAALTADGAAHLIDIGAGEATQVYAPKRYAQTRISVDGATLWTARFGPVHQNEEGEVYAPLMFEDVELASGVAALKTAVQALPTNGNAAISPEGGLFAVDTGPGDGERTLIAVFRRAEQSLAGVTTLPSDQADLTFLDEHRILLSINPPNPFGIAPGLYLWDVVADKVSVLNRPGATPVCADGRGLPRSAIVRELNQGRLNSADWAISEDGREIAFLLPGITGGSCLMRWSAEGRILPTLTFPYAFSEIAFIHRGAYALARDGAVLTVVKRRGQSVAMQGCDADAKLFASDGEPVVFCANPSGVTIHNGLSGQRYWRGAPVAPLTSVAHDRSQRRIIAADEDGRIRVWDAAPRGWPVDGADEGLRLARAGEHHVVALSQTQPARYFDLSGQGKDVTDALRLSIAADGGDPKDVLALSTQLDGPDNAITCDGLQPPSAALTATSPSGDRLAVETENGVSVYDLTTCATLLRLPSRTTGGGPLLPTEDRLWLPLSGEVAVFPLTLPPDEALGALHRRNSQR